MEALLTLLVIPALPLLAASTLASYFILLLGTPVVCCYVMATFAYGLVSGIAARNSTKLKPLLTRTRRPE